MKTDDHLDEKIIKMIDQVENLEITSIAPLTTNKGMPPEKRTIYTGIKIDGRWVEFEERPFAGAKITMMVPKEFSEMKSETAKIKYPMEQRPETILTDFEGSTNILFNHVDTPTAGEEISKIRNGLFAMMRRVNPGIKAQSMGEETIAGKTLAYVEFISPAMDGKLYNLMFFLDLNGMPLMGSFNCLTKSMKYWQKSAFEMMRSIRILETNL